MTAETLTKRTESEMIALLRARHAPSGRDNGEWAFMTGVRNEAGFKATRTIDALALSLWESRGHELHGYEVKVSRSDWLRELADPAKADGFIARCDRWWLVAAEGVAKAAEMPTGWGLLVAQGDKLRAVVQAPKLPRTPEQRVIDRSWLVCLLRGAGAVPKSRPEDIEAARDAGFNAGVASHEGANKQWRDMYERCRDELTALRDSIRAFEREAGFTLSQYGDVTGERGARAGQLVRAALDGDRQLATEHSRLLRMAEEMTRAAERLREIAGDAA
ncbi:MAG TPA: hypothetical protein VGL75_07440 [Acidothermaceae bacterium]|jgi:hypothetical protein